MKKVNTFVGVTFLLTWIMEFWLMLNGGLQNPSSTVIIIICMLMPAVGAIITVLISKEKLKDLWIKPKFKGNIKYYLLAWLMPVALIVVGSVLYYLIFPSQLDLNMTNIINTTKEQLKALGQAIPSDSELKTLMIVQIISSLFMAPIINFIPCIGEELGWRGYLLPNLLEKYSAVKATLISGIIWGLWHAPVIAMGHNYGLGYIGYPIGGIFAMTLFCIFLGSVFSYVTIKVKSCIPAVIMHAMINGFSTLGIMFMSINNTVVNPFIGPVPTGIIGGMGIIVSGLIYFKLMGKIKIDSNEYNC